MFKFNEIMSIVIASEARQSRLSVLGTLDRVAALAMTYK